VKVFVFQRLGLRAQSGAEVDAQKEASQDDWH
jgi:hypothetical protein